MKTTKRNHSIRGATIVEYVLLIGIVGASAVLGLTSVGSALSSFFGKLGTTVVKLTASI